jgi:hypothetical protein
VDASLSRRRPVAAAGREYYDGPPYGRSALSQHVLPRSDDAEARCRQTRRYGPLEGKEQQRRQAGRPAHSHGGADFERWLHLRRLRQWRAALLGIYELEGNTWKVCYAMPGKERPKDFSAKEGSGQTLAVWEREKK